jgi:Predicted Zn-dependent protease (DUF2268)
MTKSILFALAIIIAKSSFAQSSKNLNLNKEYKGILLSKTESHIYKLTLSKGGVYQFSILQQGIAAHIVLKDANNNQVFESDIPEDIDGYEKFEYLPNVTGIFYLTLARFDNVQNTEMGKATIYVKSLSKAEIGLRQKIKKELASENQKNVQTIDIDHFWEAFDNLKNCKSFADSVKSFQQLYLDRATDGLIDFIRVRDLQAEKYVKLVAKYPKFYASLRKNTFEVKKAEQTIEAVFLKFKKLYSNFKPFKVCFAMGIMNTGGTISNNFVLIGTEILSSSKQMDLSEFDANEYRKTFEGTEELMSRIKRLIAHECVHTQQPKQVDPNGIKCELLYRALREGAADFIAELVSGNPQKNEYGDKNEKQIWVQFKNELCNESSDNWLYNSSTVKDKPADLGYYVGYKIVQEYYHNASNKKQAIIDIIEMTDAVRFLELSKYDQKEKK